MEEKEFDALLDSLEEYNKNYESITPENAQHAVEDFDERWKIIINYMADYTQDRESKYGQALLKLSVAIHELSNPSENQIQRLSTLIYDFDKNKNAKCKFGYDKALFFNLGLCWYRLGKLYEIKVIEAFKKYIYYLLSISCHTIYQPTTFSFRKCTTFLYQSLINDQLNISSPSTFNDPFDTPIVELLRAGDDLSLLMYQAFQSSLKIACFTCNVKQPLLSSTSIVNEKKHNNDKEEYLNELMWAHYADYHRGICLKYSFDQAPSNVGKENPNIVSFFKDVKYSDEVLSKYPSIIEMPIEDAFFLKGKAWEYENELRYVCFDINGQGDYSTVDIPNSIEAVYFGMKCSEADRSTIINIMKSKKFIKKDFRGNLICEKPVEFYQMEIGEKHFGQLKAIPIIL